MILQLKMLYYSSQALLKALQHLEGLFREVKLCPERRHSTHYVTHGVAVAKDQPKAQPLMVPILQPPILLPSISAKHSFFPAI